MEARSLPQLRALDGHAQPALDEIRSSPSSLRRAAMVATLVGAPWILIGSGIAIGMALVQ